MNDGTPPDGDFARVIDDLGREAARRLQPNATHVQWLLGDSKTVHPRIDGADHPVTWSPAQSHEPGRVVRIATNSKDWEVLVHAFEPAIPWFKGVVVGGLFLAGMGFVFPILQSPGFFIWLVYTLFGLVRFKIPRDAALHFFRRAIDGAKSLK